MRDSRAKGGVGVLGLWLVACASVWVAVAPASAVTLSESGTGRVRIVLARGAGPAETTAAKELQRYLEQVTTAGLPLDTESDDSSGQPAIYVGPSAFAARHGIDTTAFGPEEWIVKTAEGSLILAGGRPRGTLYAVYRFLEDYVGVRWWTPWDETVPHAATLTIPEIDARGEPAFAYRDVYGVGGPPVFNARNRMNGHYSYLTRDHGGAERYGPPFQVHNVYLYAPPEEYFDRHPEYYSELDGVRTHEKAQLCLTNAGLRELAARKLVGYIEEGNRKAAESGESPPRLYGFSPNDWGGECRCEACRRVVKRQAGDAGPLVEFVNYMAARIEDKYPDVMLDTLGYYHTFHPPHDLALRDNVVVRVAGLQRRDFSKPLTDPVHWEFRLALDGWSKRTKHLRIWGYSVTFGRLANLPLPNLAVLAQDFRYYHEHGVEGLYFQHDGPILVDMRDLKLWILLKLMEDPFRDLDGLVTDFTDGYYGAAGATVREYLRELERAAARKPSNIDYPARPSQYRYLDSKFLRRAHELFDRAERQVDDDPLLLRRVQQARISLDRATLARWSRKLGRALDPEQIANRYHYTTHEMIDLRIPEGQRGKTKDKIDREIRKLWNAIP